MKPTVIEEVSEILGIFNLDEIAQMMRKQINEEYNEGVITDQVDHFKPLYYKYRSITSTDENGEEVRNAAEERFMTICNIFLKLICEKFHLELDETWKDDHYQDIPGLTMSLYTFFILESCPNIYDVCRAYIIDHVDEIYQMFEERKSKKDATTLVNKKIMSPEAAIIVSNIYDVTTWILNQLSEEQFLEYLPESYLPLNLIKKLLDEGVMSANFMIEINDVYSMNVHLKGDVCFRLITEIQSGRINI